MCRFVNRLSNWSGILAAWLFFSIGIMITYEVVMRKGFNSPTIWVDEVTTFLQIWAVYLAASYILKHRALITVEILGDKVSNDVKTWLDRFALLIIIVFSIIAIWQGIKITADSVELGRASSSMLGTPLWISESSIPIGFSLLLLQALCEIRATFISTPPYTNISPQSQETEA